MKTGPAAVPPTVASTIDEAITKFRTDLRATESKLIDGKSDELPAVLVTPRDLAILIDRLQILFGRPAQISEGRSFGATVSSAPLPIDDLRKIVELTRGLESPRAEGSPCRDCRVVEKARAQFAEAGLLASSGTH